MNSKSFLDTNILIYAFASGDPRKPEAERLMEQGGAISVQVLNEFANVSLRKLGLKWDEIAKRLETIKSLVDAPIPLTEELHDAARTIAAARKIAFYDALIIAAALAAKCKVLLSEDFQTGTKFGALEIRNPFAAP